MKNILFLRLYLLLTAIILLTACKKENTERTSPAEIIKPENEVPDTKSIPIQLQNGSSLSIFSYSEGRLTEIENADATHMVIIYDKLLKPINIETFKGSLQVKLSEYKWNDKGQVTAIEKYDAIEGELAVSDLIKLKYNDSEQLISTQTFDKENKLMNEKNMTYDQKGNRISMTCTSPAQTVTYTYDSKYALFKNIPYMYLFELETEQPVFCTSGNNVLTKTDGKNEANNIMYSYTYNGDHYPTRVKITANGKTQASYEVIYQ